MNTNELMRFEITYLPLDTCHQPYVSPAHQCIVVRVSPRNSEYFQLCVSCSALARHPCNSNSNSNSNSSSSSSMDKSSVWCGIVG